MRDAFGRALVDLVDRVPQAVVLDADNATSTRTQWLARERPDRFVNLGIAEQNAVGFAAGLALTGLRPVVCGFAAMLVNRSYDQIVQSVAYQGLPVVLVGHYAGLSAAWEGAVHHAINDLAAMRAVPGMTVVAPACDDDVPAALDAALDLSGPAYLRLARDPVPALPEPGRGGLAEGVRGWGDPTAPHRIVVSGACTGLALRAARALDEDGVPTSVVEISRLKPLPDPAEVFGSASLVVTVEDHNVIGGLGSAVAEAAAHRRGPRVIRHGVPDVFSQSGSHDDLMTHFRLTAGDVADVVRRWAHRREDR